MHDDLEDCAESRQEIITEMKTFIEHECSELGEMLAQMAWTPDHILKKKSVERVQCPHDRGHLVPQTSLQHHAAVCRLRKMGLSAEQVETEVQNDDVFYTKADLVGKVSLDEGQLNCILWNYCMEHRQVHAGHRSMPVSADDWTVKLSAQERLAVYEHCVHTLKAEGKMANVEKDEVLTTDWERIIKKGLLEQGGDKPKSGVELLAMLRDQKRRRQSYRGKNVHVTKKSYTEIIREVILNQMEIMMPREEPENDINRQSQEDAQFRGDRDSRHHSPSIHQPRHRSRSPRRRGSPGNRHDYKRRHSPSPETHSPRRQSSASSRHSYRRRDSPSPLRRRSRSISRSSAREQWRSSKHRSPHRRRSRSSSPQDRDGDSSRVRRRDAPSTASRVERTSRPDYEEGQIESTRVQKREAPLTASRPEKTDGERTDGERTSSQRRAQPDYEEGQIDSDYSDSQPRHSHTPRKKSSKHKKHKHKKKKSKSYHSDSD